jgi:hypothetical protein
MSAHDLVVSTLWVRLLLLSSGRQAFVRLGRVIVEASELQPWSYGDQGRPTMKLVLIGFRLQAAGDGATVASRLTDK